MLPTEPGEKERQHLLDQFWRMLVIGNPDWITPRTPEQARKSLIENFMSILPPEFGSELAWKEKLFSEWSDPAVFEEKNKQSFLETYFGHLSLSSLRFAGWAEGFYPVPEEKQSVTVSDRDAARIKDIADSQKTPIHVSAIFGSLANLTVECCTDGYSTSDLFSTHSVTKVLTGMLAVILIQDGIISEEALTKKGIVFPPAIQSLLGDKISERLSGVSIHQLMTHMTGIGVGEDAPMGDFFGAYFHSIRDHLEQGLAPPRIDRLEDFLTFVPDSVSEPDQRRYSNSGILLAGLAVAQLCNEHRIEKGLPPLSFDDMLKEYICIPAGMSVFDASPTGRDIKYNTLDESSAYIVGTPGGGYYTSASDLENFARFAYERYHDDEKGPEFRRLLNTYGEEFFHNSTLAHSGNGPAGSAYFSLDMGNGNLVIVMNDQRSVAASEIVVSIKKEAFGPNVSEEKALLRSPSRVHGSMFSDLESKKPAEQKNEGPKRRNSAPF